MNKINTDVSASAASGDVCGVADHPGRRQFWPFPLFRNYPTCVALTRLFLDFANAEDVKFKRKDAYYMTATCSLGSLDFWDANRWYAFAQDGTFTNSAGVAEAWCSLMPSRYAVRRFARAMTSKQFAYSPLSTS